MLDYKRKFSHTHFRFAESIEQHNVPGIVMESSGLLTQGYCTFSTGHRTNARKRGKFHSITLNKHSHKNKETTCHQAL